MFINHSTAAFEVNSVDLITSELQYFVKVWITDTAINNPNLEMTRRYYYYYYYY